MSDDVIRRSDAIKAMAKAIGRILYDAEAVSQHVMNSIPAVEPKQEWTPCSERMPEIGMKTILLYDSEEISGGTYIGNLTWNDAFASKNEFVKVIAWMPLPDPPEGADECSSK